jgi:hypothetical protein
MEANNLCKGECQPIETDINFKFLKDKGMELKPSGDTSYAFYNDKYSLHLDEWSYLSIYNKENKTRSGKCLVTELLNDDDFK